MGISESTLLYSEVDRMVIKWQGGLMSDFHKSIMTTIAKADDIGLAKIRALFPVHVQAWETWTQKKGYAETLRERLGKHPFLGHLTI